MAMEGKKWRDWKGFREAMKGKFIAKTSVLLPFHKYWSFCYIEVEGGSGGWSVWPCMLVFLMVSNVISDINFRGIVGEEEAF